APASVGDLGSIHSSSLMKANNNGFTPQYNLKLGYVFHHEYSSWLTALMGCRNAIELQVGELYSKQTQRIRNTAGTLWFIDGSGIIWDPTKKLATSVRSARVQTQDRFIDTGLFLKGHKNSRFSSIDFEPLIGVVYTKEKTKYNFLANYDADELPFTSYYDDNEIYNIDSNYYGLALGDRINLHLSTRITTFADLQLQLLRANIQLHAHQEALRNSSGVVPSGYAKDVYDSENKMTYRAKLAVGVSYQLLRQTNSPVITVSAGVDRLGYRAQVVTPDNSNQGKVHLDGLPVNNGFVSLEIKFLLD
ncbi:MAG: hypothetical protein KJ588_03500, partial [Gammaproteobacteria bacterium]|nr:hypothetical protein [Gammaproteobacteria bacterium]